MASDDKTGLCIPYSVRVTRDRGRGVFADAAIRKGTTVWRHAPGQYAVHDERSLTELLAGASHSEAVYVLTHIHSVAEFPGYMVQVFDHGELINHSARPTAMINSGSGSYEAPSVTSTQDVAAALLSDHFTLIAARDLRVGDELTLDYNSDPEDPAYYATLCERYGVAWEWLVG